MKIGVMSDIHNNLVALNHVLKYFEESDCEKLICCGDIVSIGPMPEKTVRCVMMLKNLLCVRGNHEDYLRKLGIGKSLAKEMTEKEARFHEWEFEQLGDESKCFLDLLPISFLERINGTRIYVTHYPMTGNSYIDAKRDLTLSMCEQMFLNVEADLILFGHSHKHFDYNNSSTRFINVPSLGCPSRSKNLARAGILEVNNGECIYEQVALEYDAASVIHEIDRLGYPASDEIKQIFYGM